MTVQTWSEYSYDSADLKWIQLLQSRFEVNKDMSVQIIEVNTAMTV